MQRAIEETSRRRNIQVTFNKENNIQPKSIVKEVKDIMEGARPNKRISKNRPKNFEDDLGFEIKINTPDDISSSIKLLEEKMYQFAKETEFERAAFCRDKIKDLKYQLIAN